MESFLTASSVLDTGLISKSKMQSLCSWNLQSNMGGRKQASKQMRSE